MLSNNSETLYLIKKHDFTVQKRYGQNFLIDENVLKKIVDAAEITKSDHVIEIGPGLGTMTGLLCEQAEKVTAVEIDKELIPILRETLVGYSNIEIINEDILKLDLRTCLGDGEKSYKVVANLPYYITTPIILKLLEGKYPIESITVMIQKEVAERKQAGPGTKDYGALSLAVQYYSKPVIVTEVSKNSFYPKPKVDSTVVRLEIEKNGSVTVKDDQYMFRLIRASFNQRRKTLINGLTHGIPGLAKERVEEALNEMELPMTVRGEALTLKEFARLSDLLTERQ